MDPQNNSLIPLKKISLACLEEEIIKIGEKKFRASQIKKWVYQKRVNSFEEMNNTPKDLKEKMAKKYSLQKLVPVTIKESVQGDAVKFGFKLYDSPHVVESVLLIDDNRRTACLSSQLGCALGCVFCETAKMGFIRNLTQDEIIGQLIGINDYLYKKDDKLVTNIVFMGMGEALSNFQNFRTTLDIIMNEECFNIGGRRITVSTAGVIPSIEKLIAENLNIGLAISLNAYSDEQRSKLMPINSKYPIKSLIEIAKKYFEKTGRRVTFEYVLIAGETDSDTAADELRKLLGGFPCKINVIPINPGRKNKITPPDESLLMKFTNKLHQRGLAATLRKSRGQDIWGACGQLAGSYIGENANSTTSEDLSIIR